MKVMLARRSPRSRSSYLTGRPAPLLDSVMKVAKIESMSASSAFLLLVVSFSLLFSLKNSQKYFVMSLNLKWFYLAISLS